MPELPEEPLNREPEVGELASSFITYKNGYDRNHSSIPHLDGTKHTVRVDGAVAKQLELSMADLKTSFDQHTVVCCLQCAGNRRHTMRTWLKEVQGIDWFSAAVMNCEWRGPRLRDVLARAGITLSGAQKEKAHVAFACYSVPCENTDWYGASISLSRALNEDADVILALEMNGKPLSAEHGYPVRVVTPGIAGARAVKWLDKITVQMDESDNFYMKRDYKVLPEEAVDAETAEPFWDKAPAVMDMPINSVVVSPMSGETLTRNSKGNVKIRGYALPSGDFGDIAKVEVSSDGLRWSEAKLLRHDQEEKWSWKLWEAELSVNPGNDKTIFSRAVDQKGNTQPRYSNWNLRGVCYNGYGESRNLVIE